MTAVRKMRILIAEDDEFYVKILIKYLQKEDVEVAISNDGRKAYKKALEFKPDLVISDWMMPEMTGIELCTALRETDELDWTYFIMLTAKDDIEDLVLSFEKGADDFLTKPCNPQELLARVRTGLRLVQLQQENEQLQHVKAVNQTAITANHEINNPLQAIYMYAESMLSHQDDLPESIEKGLKQIMDNVGRIRKVTQKLENLIQVHSKEYISEGPEMIDLGPED